MSVLGKRVSRLEGPTSDEMSPVAVVFAPLPIIITDEWASALLALYGWSGRTLYIMVRDGPEALSLKPVPFPPIGSEADRTCLEVFTQYPNATILSTPSGLLAKRHENDADFRQWMVDLEKELVT